MHLVSVELASNPDASWRIAQGLKTSCTRVITRAAAALPDEQTHVVTALRLNIAPNDAKSKTKSFCHSDVEPICLRNLQGVDRNTPATWRLQHMRAKPPVCLT